MERIMLKLKKDRKNHRRNSVIQNWIMHAYIWSSILRKKRRSEEHEEVLGRGCKCSEGNYCCSFPQLVGLPSGELLRRCITSYVSVAARVVIKVDFTHVICSDPLPEKVWLGGRVSSWAGSVAARGGQCCWGELCTPAALLPALCPPHCSQGLLFEPGDTGPPLPLHSMGFWVLFGRREQSGCSPWKGLTALVVY